MTKTSFETKVDGVEGGKGTPRGRRTEGVKELIGQEEEEVSFQ